MARDGRRAPAAFPTFDFRLTDTLDDITEIVGAGFITTLANVDDGDLTGTGRNANDQIAGFSFSGIPQMPCSLATLTIRINTQFTIGGTYRVRGSLGETARFTTGHRPTGATPTTAIVTLEPTTVGVHNINITAIVQEILAATFNGFVNVWFEADSIGSSFICDDTTANPTTAARLVIVP